VRRTPGSLSSAGTVRARASLHAGDSSSNAAPELLIHGDPSGLRETATSWLEDCASTHATVRGRRTRTYDYRTSHSWQRTQMKRKRCRRAAIIADAEAAKATRAAAEANDAARSLLSAMRPWTANHPLLTDPLTASAHEATDSSLEKIWGIEDIEQLAEAEPAMVLSTCDAWARHAVAACGSPCSRPALTCRTRYGPRCAARETSLARRKEAQDLRAGRLLPCPAATGLDRGMTMSRWNSARVAARE